MSRKEDVDNAIWGEWCWACDEARVLRTRCPACGAPVRPELTERNRDSGVYIVQADCGLVKIGVSGQVHRRVGALRRKSAEELTLCWVIWGAGCAIECWLHELFADTRDEKEAVACGLPHPSEWFWPTPTMRRLAVGDGFLCGGALWEDAMVEGVAV